MQFPRKPLVFFILFALGYIADCAFDYLTGYGAIGDAGLFSACYMAASIVFKIAFILLSGAWVVSLFKKKDRRAVSLLLVTALLLFFGMARFAPGLVDGLHNRAIHDNSLDGLRQFAKDIDKKPVQPKKFGLHQLDDMIAKYPFIGWGRGPAHVRETGNIVTIEWRGVSPEYWGFHITVDGKKIDPAAEGAEGSVIDLADDITIFHTFE